MAKKKFYRTLLIVCEGTETEPKYFKYLRTICIKKQIWSKIDILPTSSIDEGITYKPNQRKKRTFNTNVIVDNRFKDYLLEIYDESSANAHYENNKQEPVRFVAEAKLKLENEGYNEAWTVFDEDDRNLSHLKRAFELSKEKVENHLGEEKFVQIAFSSRSFEYWFLLHFEQANIIFLETECKDKTKPNKPSYECGTNKNPANDCKGKICLVGYLRENHYPNFAKNQIFDRLGMNETDFEERQKIAFQNATWLRYSVDKTNSKLPIYKKKPYTDVDYLVKSILGIDIVHRYAELNEKIDVFAIKNLNLYFSNTNTIEFTFEEIASNPLTFSFYLIDKPKDRIKLTVLEKSFNHILDNQKFHVEISNNIPDSELHIETETEILIVKL